VKCLERQEGEIDHKEMCVDVGWIELILESIELWAQLTYGVNFTFICIM
jgi:hypothetical protein